MNSFFQKIGAVVLSLFVVSGGTLFAMKVSPTTVAQSLATAAETSSASITQAFKQTESDDAATYGTYIGSFRGLGDAFQNSSSAILGLGSVSVQNVSDDAAAVGAATPGIDPSVSGTQSAASDVYNAVGSFFNTVGVGLAALFDNSKSFVVDTTESIGQSVGGISASFTPTAPSTSAVTVNLNSTTPPPVVVPAPAAPSVAPIKTSAPISSPVSTPASNLVTVTPSGASNVIYQNVVGVSQSELDASIAQVNGNLANAVAALQADNEATRESITSAVNSIARGSSGGTTVVESGGGLTSTDVSNIIAATTSLSPTNLTATNGTISTLTIPTLTGSTQCLEVNSSGVVIGTGLACGSGGSGGSDLNWTFFNNSGIHPATSTNQVLIGLTSTSSLSKLEVHGGATIDNATTTNATSTNFFVTNLNFTNATGNLTGNITGTAPAGSLTGTTLNSSVVTSSLTSVGTLSAGAVPASLITSGTFGAGNYIFPGQLQANSSTTLQNFTALNSTSSNATTTSLFATNAVATNVTATNFFGAGLSTCNGASSALIWGGGQFGCNTISGSGGGSDINWTFFNNSGIHPATSTNQVLIGLTSTSSLSKLEVHGGATIDNATTTNATSTNFALLGLATPAGAFLAVNANGQIISTTTPSGGSSFGYLFGLAGNATSTLTQFNGGLTAYASSTIGNGNQNGGLTISGGATTTGASYIGGQLSVNGSLFLNSAVYGNSSAQFSGFTNAYNGFASSPSYGYQSGTAGMFFDNANTALGLSSNSIEGLRISSTGNTQVGTSSIASGVNQLTVQNLANNTNIAGFYSHSGAPQLLLTNGGTVGIGTATPNGGYGLDVENGAILTNGNNVAYAFYARNTGSPSSVMFGNNSTGNTGLWFPSTTSVGLSTNGTNALTISSSQLVGIGTSSPFAALDILSTSKNQTPLFDIASSTNGAATSTAFFVNPNGNIGINTSSPISSARLTLDSGYQNSAGGFAITDDSANTGYSTPNEIGQVGEANASNGGLGLAGWSWNNDSPAVTLNGETGAGYLTPAVLISGYARSGTSPVSMSNNQTVLGVVNGSGSTGKLLTVMANGAVGVGTSSPTDVLSIRQGVGGPFNLAAFYDSSGNQVATISQYGVITTESKIQSTNNTIEGAQIQADNGVYSGAGSASLPSYSFSSDLHTGIYNPSPSVIAFSSGGTTTLTILANGDVGIGTTSPFSLLSVGGPAYIGGNLTATGTVTITPLATPAGAFLAVNGNGQIIATTTPSGGGGTNYFTNSGANTYLSTGTKLGVGSSSPYATLSIQGSSDIPQLIVQGNGTQTNNLQDWENSAGTVKAAVDGSGNFAANSGDFPGGVNTNLLVPHSGANTTLEFQERNFSNAGVMDSFDSGTFTNSSGLGNAFAITPTYNQTGTAAGTDLLINRAETATGTGAQYLADFQVGNADRFVFTDTGREGIGTSSPASTLTVVGSGCISKGAGASAPCSTTAGTMTADAFNTAAADVAEDYQTSDSSMGPGDIAAADPSNNDSVVKASAGSTVIGVISTKPGLLLGSSGSNSLVPVALSGRVPTLVNNEGGSIAIGDAIALSSVPGVGKKAAAGESTVGIALAPMTETSGTIDVFVSLGASSADSAASTSTIATIVTDWFSSLGVSIANNIFHFTSLIADSFTATTEYVNTINAQTIDAQTASVGALSVGSTSTQSTSGITILDRATGNPYCIFINNGIMQSTLGACGSFDVSSGNQNNSSNNNSGNSNNTSGASDNTSNSTSTTTNDTSTSTPSDTSSDTGTTTPDTTGSVATSTSDTGSGQSSNDQSASSTPTDDSNATSTDSGGN